MILKFLLALTMLLILLGLFEALAHKKHLKKIPIRIHVNGTRGKSSVTRLIAAGLREGGVVTCAKTTGTLPRLILPDGREVPVYRPSKANVIEQIRIVAAAAAYNTQVLVIECMALQPELQWLSEHKFVKATHGVITNTREDHLDVMGPTEKDVAKALAGMIPFNAKLYTGERRHLAVLQKAADDRKTQLVAVTQEDVLAVTPEQMAGFSYREHEENVALAFHVCSEFNVPPEVAIKGMWAAKPDPGAMTEHRLDFFGKKIFFVNGFAANDPESTEMIWKMTLEKYKDVRKTVAIFNCRADRPDRSRQLGRALVNWPMPDHIVLMGDGTYIFAREAINAGVAADKLVFQEGRDVDEIFEAIVGLIRTTGLAMGMANIGGQGLDLVAYFKNRETIEEPI